MPGKTQKNVGKLLKIERLKLDIRLKDMAQILDVTPATISYIEGKTTDNPFVRYLKYLKSQNVDLNEIF